MKHIITISTVLLILSMSSMAQTPGLSNYLNAFSFDIYKEINQTNKNVFFSPLSTYLALSIAYEGSKSETKTEFENVLHIGDQTLHKSLIEYASSLSNEKSKENYLNIANAIWIQDKSHIDRSYIKFLVFKINQIHLRRTGVFIYVKNIPENRFEIILYAFFTINIHGRFL